jgi:hypothetical protein
MPFIAVEKATGEIEEWPQIEYLDRVQAMIPCGGPEGTASQSWPI